MVWLSTSLCCLCHDIMHLIPSATRWRLQAVKTILHSQMLCTANATAWQKTISIAPLQQIQPSRWFNVGSDEMNPHLRFPVLSALPVNSGTAIHPNATPVCSFNHVVMATGKIAFPSPAAEQLTSLFPVRVCPSQFIFPTCRWPNHNTGAAATWLCNRDVWKGGMGIGCRKRGLGVMNLQQGLCVTLGTGKRKGFKWIYETAERQTSCCPRPSLSLGFNVQTKEPLSNFHPSLAILGGALLVLWLPVLMSNCQLGW